MKLKCAKFCAVIVGGPEVIWTAGMLAGTHQAVTYTVVPVGRNHGTEACHARRFMSGNESCTNPAFWPGSTPDPASAA